MPKSDIQENLKEIKDDLPREWSEYFLEFENVFSGNVAYKIQDVTNHCGYVVNTLEIALWGFFNSSFIEDGIYKILELGGDKDTNGAIGGGLCGLYYGLKGKDLGAQFIENQKDLTDMIIKKDLILKIIDDFVEYLVK